MSAPDLDAWVPKPLIRTRHRQASDAGADVLWHAAETIRLRETRSLGRLVRWRIPGLGEDVAFRDLFRQHPFIVLDEGDRWSVSGLVGRIWTLDRDYPRLAAPPEFAAWDEPGTARVLFAHWVEDGALVSEARVDATNRSAALRVRAVWGLVGGFERLIGGEALALAARRAAQSGTP